MTGLPVSSLSQSKTSDHFSPSKLKVYFFSSDFLSPLLDAERLPGSSARVTLASPIPIPNKKMNVDVTQCALAGSDCMSVPPPRSQKVAPAAACGLAACLPAGTSCKAASGGQGHFRSSALTSFAVS